MKALVYGGPGWRTWESVPDPSIIAPTDAITFGLVAVVLLAAALLAGFVPARRAARVDPMIAMRGD